MPDTENTAPEPELTVQFDQISLDGLKLLLTGCMGQGLGQLMQADHSILLILHVVVVQHVQVLQACWGLGGGGGGGGGRGRFWAQVWAQLWAQCGLFGTANMAEKRRNRRKSSKQVHEREAEPKAELFHNHFAVWRIFHNQLSVWRIFSIP